MSATLTRRTFLGYSFGAGALMLGVTDSLVASVFQVGAKPGGKPWQPGVYLVLDNDGAVSSVTLPVEVRPLLHAAFVESRITSSGSALAGFWPSVDLLLSERQKRTIDPWASGQRGTAGTYADRARQTHRPSLNPWSRHSNDWRTR